MKRKKICIIGAGLAGLIAIRHISRSPGLHGIVFEERGDLGGLWVYTDKTKAATGSAYGPMYKYMRTNLPKELMGFPDFPFPGAFSANQDPSSFLHHSEVLKFLHSYADHFQLRDHIKFHRRVVDIRPIHSEPEQHGSSTPRWHVTVHVTSRSGDTTAHNGYDHPSVEEFEFDAVLICNGHWAKPLMPDIENMEEFQGMTLHSKDYDDASSFAAKRIVVVGCGTSGIDISLQLAEVASEVIISNKKAPLTFSLPSNVRVVSKIKSATRDGFLCENGELILCDAIILSTGYVFDFPFLSPECGVEIENSQRISPLYRDMIHAKYTTLCFIGIQLHVIPMLLFDCQVRFCVKLLEGHVELPSMELMIEEIANERKLRDSLNPSSLSWSHQLGVRQWKYCETLAEDAKFQLDNFPLLIKIGDKSMKRLFENPRAYKNDMIYATYGDPNSLRYVEAPDLLD